MNPVINTIKVIAGIILIIIGLIGGLFPIFQGWVFGIPGLIILAFAAKGCSLYFAKVLMISVSVEVQRDMQVDMFNSIVIADTGLIDKKHSVYFGTRSHKKSIVQRNFIRKILGDIGSVLISIILNISIKDTQCGYKLYKKKLAKFAFSKLKNYGWDHDIELILLLKSKKVKIKELPVRWIHKDNSKVNVLLDPIKMFIGIIVIRFRYL